MTCLNDYKDTEMYHIMKDWILSNAKVKEKTKLEEDIMSLSDRENLKWFADKLAKRWLLDGAIVMKDIAHRHSYLEAYPEKKTDFFDYVQWKYTNPDLLT